MIAKSKPEGRNVNETEVDLFLKYVAHYFTTETARTKSAIAAEVGISRMYLDGLIKGKDSNPSLAVTARLAKAMGVKLSEILDSESVLCG